MDDICCGEVDFPQKREAKRHRSRAHRPPRNLRGESMFFFPLPFFFPGPGKGGGEEVPATRGEVTPRCAP